MPMPHLPPIPRWPVPRRRETYHPPPHDFTYFVLLRDPATGKPVVVTDLYTDRPAWRRLLRRSRFAIRRLELGRDGLALVEYLYLNDGGEETL